MEISLAGKSALVTGAGRGIGLAIAQKLATAGASVLLVDVDTAALEQAEKSLPAGRVSTLAGDLTRSDFPQAAVDKLIHNFGSVDIIVNSAGYTWDSVIQKTTDEQFQAMLDIHAVTPFR